MKRNLNVYTCKKCGNQIVTCHVCDGVTPAMIGCDKCKDGNAWSAFYNVPQNLKPKYEWFKPTTTDEIRKQIEWEMITFHGKHIEAALIEIGIGIDALVEDTKKNHVDKGGLLLRDLSGGGR